MNILITGCAGFIGAHLAAKLLQEGHQIVGIDNLNDYYNPQLKKLRLNKLIGQNKCFKFIKKDINDQTFIEKVFKQYHFNLVIHMAAQAGVRYSLINPYAYEKNNLLGLLNLLEVIRKQSKKPGLIFASSSSVYGASRKIPFNETDPCDQPVSLYSVTKRAGELMIQSYYHLFGLKACCLRFFTVYGPWGRPDMAYFDFTRRLYAGQPITLYQKNTKRDFTYIDDIISAIVLAIGRPFDFEIINLGNSRPVTLQAFISILERETGKKAKIKLKKLPKTDLSLTIADISKAKKVLSWQPKTDIQIGLKRFVEWYRSLDFQDFR